LHPFSLLAVGTAKVSNVPQQGLAVVGRLETEALTQLSEYVDEGAVALSGDTLLLVQLLNL